MLSLNEYPKHWYFLHLTLNSCLLINALHLSLVKLILIPFNILTLAFTIVCLSMTWLFLWRVIVLKQCCSVWCLWFASRQAIKIIPCLTYIRLWRIPGMSDDIRWHSRFAGTDSPSYISVLDIFFKVQMFSCASSYFLLLFHLPVSYM